MTRTSAPMAGLQGLRVIEIARGMAASYAGKVLAELGALVLKIEPPEGDPLRHWGPFPGGKPDPESSALFAAVHAGKRGAVLNLASADAHKRLHELASRADLIVHDLPPARMAAHGLDFAALAKANPALVLLSLTSFGLTGPYRDFAACDLTLIHSGGWGWLSPGGLNDPALPPLKPFGQQSLIQAGIHGAIAALAAVRAAQAGGVGEHIDLSVQEVVAGMLEMNLVKYTYGGVVPTRLGGHLFGPWGFYPCRDGHVFMVCVEEDQWRRLVELMGKPEWATLDVLGDVYQRGENADFLDLNLRAWTREWAALELFHACQLRRICAAPVFTHAQLAAEPHLHERGFFVEHEHPRLGKLRLPGAPWRLKHDWWALRSPAPELGAANAALDAVLPPRPRPPARRVKTPAPLPLDGVRVLDLTWVWAGPYCAMHLAHLGAEVIKIESGLRPDLGRRVRIYPQGQPESLNRAGYFNQWGQGKKSVTVNLATPEGIEVVKRLAAQCDVVVDNFATGVTERMGLSPEVFQAVKPELIVASISGYGKTGPLARYMGYGPSIPPLGGLTSVTGYADGLPREVGMSYGDPNGGIHAALAIVAALYAQRNAPEGTPGQVIDGSLWEAMIAVGIEGWVGNLMRAGYRPMGNRDPRWAPHNLYRCAGEDAWAAIACQDESEWRRLCGEMGQPKLADDPRFGDLAARKSNEDALDALISAWTAPQERWAVTRRLQARGIAAFPSLSAKDLVEDPHLNARGYFTRLPHAEVGVQTHSGIPWRLTNRPNGVRHAAPLLGEHTEQVLHELLGMSYHEIQALQRQKVLA